MKAAVRRFVIFALALGTHGEPAHLRIWPVIRNFVDDGEPRSTIGAVCKCIPRSSIPWIKDFFQAFRTGGQVREDRDRLCVRIVTEENDEILIFRLFCQILSGGVGDVGHRRSFLDHTAGESFHRFADPLNLHDYPTCSIRYRTRQDQFIGESVDERPETDALDSPLNCHSNPLHIRKKLKGNHDGNRGIGTSQTRPEVVLSNYQLLRSNGQEPGTL
jgi:hypothetical protein